MPKQPKDDDTPLVELKALFPIGGRVKVKEPVEPPRPEATDDEIAAYEQALDQRGEVTLRVRELTMREIWDALAEVTNIVANIEGGKKWIDVARDHYDDVCRILAIATNRPAEWIAGLAGGDSVRLWKAFLGENESFFTEVVDLFAAESAAARMVDRLMKKLGAGQTRSSSSSSTE